MPSDRDTHSLKLETKDRLKLTRWPMPLSHYDYMRTLSKADCAWEFLRRNPRYQADYLECRANITHTKENEILVIRQSRDCPAAERWGCLTFADPDISAPSASVFWRPETGAPSLNCVASKSVDVMVIQDRFTNRGINLSLLVIGEKQYLRLSRGLHTLTLVVTGISILSNARLSFLISGCGDIGRSIDALRLFKEFLTLAPLAPAADAPWTGRCLALRDSVVALDGASAKASYRDIAKVLVGEDRCARDWRVNTALKDRVRRALSRGRAMFHGGYLALLNGEWR